MPAASLAQLEFIESLARQARVPVDLDRITTMHDASVAIDDLSRQVELSPRTRAKIFASLKKAGRSKEDMYMALGLDSIAVTSMASEHDGQRCLAWIRGHETEVRRQPQPENFVDALAEVQAASKPLPPRRPRTNPFAEQPPAPVEPTPPVEPVVEAPRPAPAPTRAPRRPPAMQFVQDPIYVDPCLIPGIDTDPTTGEVLAFSQPIWRPPAPRRSPLITSLLERFPSAVYAGQGQQQ